MPTGMLAACKLNMYRGCDRYIARSPPSPLVLDMPYLTYTQYGTRFEPWAMELHDSVRYYRSSSDTGAHTRTQTTMVLSLSCMLMEICPGTSLSAQLTVLRETYVI